MKKLGWLRVFKNLSEEWFNTKVSEFQTCEFQSLLSNSYKQCQFLLRKEEIKNKVSILVRQKKEFDKVKSAIQSRVLVFDFAHVLR